MAAELAPVPRMAHLLAEARKAGASDIHIIAGLPPSFRVDGEIIMAGADVLSRDQTRTLTTELLNDRQLAEFEAKGEICVSVFGTAAGRIRLTGYLHGGNPEASIRLCNVKIPSAAELGLPEVADEMTRRAAGIVLITGPTGVGKTTTLNYMVDLINHERRCKIVTIEDPIEYVHLPRRALVVQQELHTDVSSFAGALRHVLRQDPDIIVIGEMRDLETIETALVAAETGHLVIATLHTPSTSQAVERITAVFAPEQRTQTQIQLAESLQGVLAQKLLPRADKKGRVLACEVMMPTTGIRHMIREGNFHQLQNALETGAAAGMRTMDWVLRDLYGKGEITWDVALSHARNPNSLRDDG